MKREISSRRNRDYRDRRIDIEQERKTEVIQVPRIHFKKSYLVFFIIFAILVVGILMIFKPFSKNPAEDKLLTQKRGEALSLFNSGKVKEALPLLEEVDKGIKNDTDVKTALAYAYRVDGKNDMSLKKYKEILEYNPNERGTHFRLGIYLRLDGKHEESAEHLEKAAEISPNTQFYVELSKTYEALGKFDKAEKAMRKAANLTDDAGYKNELLKQAAALKSK